jgi:hypothetical protein
MWLWPIELGAAGTSHVRDDDIQTAAVGLTKGDLKLTTNFCCGEFPKIRVTESIIILDADGGNSNQRLQSIS